MLKVALTGGIASGKSTVAAMFKELGAPIIDTDVLAREVVEPGTEGLAEIVAAFGRRVLDRAGRLDRAGLRQVVFADPKARERLEEITHPRISALVEKKLKELETEGSHQVALVDVPLLFEVGWQGRFDSVILVYVPPQVQLDRLAARDGCGPEQARAALKAQMPLAQKRSLSTFVIDNSGIMEETRRRVREVWNNLQPKPVSAHQPESIKL